MNRDGKGWPWSLLFLWAVLASLALAWRGPALLRSFSPADGRFEDFSQEWASARNLLHGLPVYADLQGSLAAHTGRRAHLPAGLRWNAPPPAAVLLALPLAGLEYAD